MNKLTTQIHIFLREAFATCLWVVPSFIHWLIRRIFLQQITSYPLSVIIDQKKTKGTLYLHGSLKEEGTAILLLHGDYSHPCTLLHLADLAHLQGKGTVFNLYLPYDESHSAASRALLNQAIDKIEEMYKVKKMTLQGIVGVGHSSGAMRLAFQALVDKDKRLKAIFSVGGRFKLLPKDDQCSKQLRTFIEPLSKALEENSIFPLSLIVGEKDWCVPFDAAHVRPDAHIEPNGLHLNILFSKKTRSQFTHFLDKQMD